VAVYQQKYREPLKGRLVAVYQQKYKPAFERFYMLLLINDHKPQPLRGSLYFC
jgi:hypothetical protein